ncbi:substrate-binding domain-containing protein [Clostridium sp. C105KSO13]|uniref:substrate-binding domain-containing protein n=1 Tax=Clostridium sp. C105KSO13 TaxID=1776045 RepID=UPI0007407F0C|nr:substrate-binding domain-containing protein [Clostridium sp. C105KSO13]CUX38476.1 D-ribose-binding periplasmic protein precursor [Clostridium sp. C105KSO13]
MKKKLLTILLCASLAGTLAAGCGGKDKEESSSADSGGEKKGKVILITMDSTDQHWVSVDKGAKEEAEKLGVDYAWMAPDKKDDAQQIERVNNAVADGADAIMIAANGPDAITSALDEAKEEGIKIIYVDSPANTKAEATFATDNEAAGKTAGEELIKGLEAANITEGKIGIVGVNPATQSTVDREKGFRSAFEGSKYELLETQFGEGDTAKSQDIADNYITDGCIGIFGTNEGSTVGTGNAVKGDGGSVIAVGFDKSDAILSLIEDGSLLCVMSQNPDVMGSEGMKAAVKVINGEEITEKDVDTGVSVISKDNVADFQ